MENFKDFCVFLNVVRTYFLERGFLETPTPSLVDCPGMEAHLQPLEVKSSRGIKHLPTSPEVHLKKYLCQGFKKIFELRPCFRDDPVSPLHRHEFFMLEWYRAGEPLSSLQEDLIGLITRLKQHGIWQGEVTYKKYSFRALFKTQFGFDFKPDTSESELKELFRSREIYFHDSDSKVDLIHRLLLERFEPVFKGLTFLEEFPAEMAVLSQIGREGFANRFEFYFGPMELANAFDEVTDPEVQRQRWSQDLNERKYLGAKELPMDQELLGLMESPGLPPSSGIALGLDRLFMAARGLNDISQIGFS